MPVNDGVVQRFVSSGTGGGVTVEVYYNHTIPYDPPNQAIINDTSRGHGNVALWCNNTTNHSVPVHIMGGGIDQVVDVPPGETTRTANQLAAVGVSTREDAQTLTLASG